jgi:S1-C subfamily serine protease
MNKVVTLFFPLFTAVAVFLTSCASDSAKVDFTVKKVDGRIIEEFNENIEVKDFYQASQSYIEFSNCCEDERKQTMIGELFDLYEVKKRNFEDDKDTLSLVEHTYSLINLFEEDLTVKDLEQLQADLNGYLHRYMDNELAEMGELERVSWLLYLTRFLPNEPDLYRSIVELYVERKNPVLAKKYYESYAQLVRQSGDVDSENELEAFEIKIHDLRSRGIDGTDMLEISIKDTIKSSVKIIVDKGIKTEGGVGLPDQALGTGVVIDKNGYIITNYHIIESSVDPKYEGYSRIYVMPEKDENIRFVAKVLGHDPLFDLALLKIEKKLETYVRFGDSSTLDQGEKVVAIGNPVGLTNSVTSGIVSSLDRPFIQIGNIIQIDAALNPGNSGGALINGSGYLVGIAFAGLENFQNLNFAIPSNLLLSLLFKLYEEGKTSRSWIGCSVGKKDVLSIEYIVPNSPAHISRLMSGDIIKEINGKPVSEIYDIQNMISYFNSPMVVNMTVERDEKEAVKKILLGNRPELPSLYVYDHDAKENIITPLFGLVLTKLDPTKKKAYLVSRIISGSVASSVGISEGDEIKIKAIKYDEENKVFLLAIDLKSKRYGYLNKSMVLYSFAEINSFI